MQVLALPDSIRGVIFDIDRTLYTNDEYAHGQILMLIQRLAIERDESVDETRELVDGWREEHARKNGGIRQSLGNTFVGLGVPMETSIRWREELIHPESYLEPDDRLRECLDRLRAQFRLVAVTNNPVSTGRRTLKALGVEECFLSVIGLDTTGKSKPDIAPFQVALQVLECDARDVVSIGDRMDVDIEPARRLGMAAILVDGVEDVYGLPELLQCRIGGQR